MWLQGAVITQSRAGRCKNHEEKPRGENTGICITEWEALRFVEEGRASPAITFIWKSKILHSEIDYQVWGCIFSKSILSQTSSYKESSASKQPNVVLILLQGICYWVKISKESLQNPSWYLLIPNIFVERPKKCPPSLHSLPTGAQRWLTVTICSAYLHLTHLTAHQVPTALLFFSSCAAQRVCSSATDKRLF